MTMRQVGVLCFLAIGFGRGVLASESTPPSQRLSSILLLSDLSESDVAQAIRLAKLSGSHVGLDQECWARCADDYEVHPAHFPNGLAGLGRTVDELHAAGSKVMLHVAEPYAEQRPDPVLKKVEVGVLSQRMNRVVRRVFTAEAPANLPKQQALCVLQIDDEFITFRGSVHEGALGFEGCGRAAFGTSPREHAQGTVVYHMLDAPRLCFLPDKSRAIKIARRVADVFRSCKFDFVYLEGNRLYGHVLSAFGAQIETALLDTVDPKLVLSSSVARAAMSPSARRVTGLRGSGSIAERFAATLSERRDSPHWMEWLWRPALPTCSEAERVCVRALAWDTPLVIRAHVRLLVGSDRAERLLRLVGAAGAARRSGDIDAEAKDRVRTSLAAHMLAKRNGRWRLLRIEKAVRLSEDPNAEAFALASEGEPLVAYVHKETGGKLFLPAQAGELTVHDRYGRPVTLAATQGWTVVPIGDLKLLALRDNSRKAALLSALPRARVMTVKTLWIQAENCESIVGKMAKGSAVGLTDRGALDDFIVATAASGPGRNENWYCRYRLGFPRSGVWHLWGRVRYEDTNTNSFSFAQGDSPNTSVKFGNDMTFKKWHWDRGPALHYDKGANTFRVYEREGSADVKKSPRLDVICFTDDPNYRPNDADARLGLVLGIGQPARGKQ